MNIQGAYAELRVLDLGQGVAAPYCAMLLAMHGAEVIKLEPLAGGRVNAFDDWLADPHIVATSGAVYVDQPEMGQFPAPRTPGIPLAVDAALPPAPRIGEDGAAISPRSASTRGQSRAFAPRKSCSSARCHDRAFRPASAPLSRTALLR